VLAAETWSQGGRRLANDQHAAMQLLAASNNWADANLLIEQGALRERRALNSMRVIAGNDRQATATIDTFVKLVDGREAQLLNELRTFYASKYGRAPETRMTEAETAASRKVPTNIGSTEEYFAKRRFTPSGMHSLMYSETMNFVDGKRSYYDIYKAVKAESLAAGKFFYGTVTLADVVKVLDANVAAGALRLR